MKINKSISIWTVAFLSVDLLFWIFIGITCLSDAISCQENAMFGAYFYYLPFTLLPWAMPLWLYSIAHAALGVVIGWLLRYHPVRWWLAGIIACIVLIGVPYGLGQWQMQQELKRETTTQLWLIDRASQDELSFSVAQQLEDGSLKVEAGHGTYNLAAFDTSHTQVTVLMCQQLPCTETTTLSYSDYLVAKSACHKDKTTCPYYQLGSLPTLFEVTLNPKAILSMRQLNLSNSSIPLQ